MFNFHVSVSAAFTQRPFHRHQQQYALPTIAIALAFTLALALYKGMQSYVHLFAVTVFFGD